MEPSKTARGFTNEFLAASAVFVLCLLWIFRAPLLAKQVEAFQAKPPSSTALLDFSEMVYEVEAAIVTQTRIVKEGFFPSWTPYSAGGNPLIGKMQNGVFAPEHLLLYAFPSAAIPYLLMLAVAWKLYLAFIFTYLYARCLRLEFFGGIFAGIVYVFWDAVNGGLFSWSGAAPYLPLLLLLVESYLSGRRRLAQFLLPWAVAFSFFSGHFESAFYIEFVAGLYFLGRLWNDAEKTRSAKIDLFLGFAAPVAAGLVIAGVQIAPAFEYVRNSYNAVWHGMAFWDYETIGKHLSIDDLPMLGLGFAGLIFFASALKRFHRTSGKPLVAARLLPLTVAALSLAWAIACLSNLGLDDSLSPLACCADTAALLGWVIGLLMLFLSFWAWRADDQPPGIKILGGVLIGSMALMLKLPLFSNLLLHLPFFKHFHNAKGHRWEFQLATAVLCAAAFQKIKTLAQGSWPRRRETALRAFCVLGVFLGGYLASRPLKGLAARLIPAGIPPSDVPAGGPPATVGGIMGPQRLITYDRTQTVVGWVPASPSVSSIAVELVQAGHALSDRQVAADVSSAGQRRYFHALVPVPDQPGDEISAALVKYADGTQRGLEGGVVEIRTRGKSRDASAWLLVAALSTFPLIFLCGAIVPRGVAALLLLWIIGQYSSAAIPAAQRPYQLGGIEKIKGDDELLRIGSLQKNFLRADYSNVYGIADIRPGGDNLDVLTLLYFDTLGSKLLRGAGRGENDLHGTESPGDFDAGLRLFGLANVKYFVDLPNSTVSHPSLAEFYRGADMTVFKNEQFRPRAAFYDRYAYLPMGDWKDFDKRTDFLVPLYRLVKQGAFNDQNILLLNDPPTEPLAASAPAGAARSSVQIKKHSPDEFRIDVDADRPGFLFLADTYFPGWVAFRNGMRVPILRSWLTFRAVQVPAGKSSVVFVYRPVALLTALILSVTAALAWLILYRRYRFGPPISSSAGIPPAADKIKKKKISEADEDAEMIVLCSASAEWIMVSLVASVLLFWTVWSAVRYKGGIQRGWSSDGFGVNAAACALLGAGAAALFRDLRSRLAAARP